MIDVMEITSNDVVGVTVISNLLMLGENANGMS